MEPAHAGDATRGVDAQHVGVVGHGIRREGHSAGRNPAHAPGSNAIPVLTAPETFMATDGPQPG